MFTKRLSMLAAAAVLAAAGCQGRVETPTNLEGVTGVTSDADSTVTPVEITLQSEAIAEDGTIATRYTCDGRDISPSLSWSGVPEGAEALVLLVDDPDAAHGTFSHWVVVNLPPNLNRIEAGIPKGPRIESVEGSEAMGTIQGTNGFQNIGYNGPCPPEGMAHRYVFNLFALDQPLYLDNTATRDRVLDAMRGHVLGEGRLTATYARQRTN